LHLVVGVVKCPNSGPERLVKSRKLVNRPP
jgi:hypothetical protein